MMFDMILDVMGRGINEEPPRCVLFDMILDVMGRGINEEPHGVSCLT